MSVMYVEINFIIVRQEIEINSDQIPPKNCRFLQIALFAMPFCVLPFSVYASLHTAFLRDAFLHVGSLRDAPLRIASLRYAFLRFASLSYASLRADF